MFSRVVGQTDIKERLLQEAQVGRVPHALLLSGSSGCGKLALAVSYAQYLLCHRPGAHDALKRSIATSPRIWLWK